MSDMPDWFSRMLTEATMTGEHNAAWTNFNRWAAFTDDELNHILDGLKLARGAEQPRLDIREGLLRWQQVNRLADDITAEIERRKT